MAYKRKTREVFKIASEAVLLYCPFQLVTALIQYGGRNVRSSDLFGQNKTPLSLTRRFFKGLKVCLCICLNITFQKEFKTEQEIE